MLILIPKKIQSLIWLVLVSNRKNFLEKVQIIEYKMIAFMRRLLSFVEGVYVTPGPLAMYRKNAFDRVGGFDQKNLTEDIEITWHLVKDGYLIRMSSNARVFTITPNKWKVWFRQRIRWNMGGIQTILKYKQKALKILADAGLKDIDQLKELVNQIA